MGLVRGINKELDSNGGDPEVIPPPLNNMIEMCQTIKENSMVVCTVGALEVTKALCQCQAHLQKMSREGESRPLWITSFICS